jgi:type IV fimbrial biogenesis protein FimT
MHTMQAKMGFCRVGGFTLVELMVTVSIAAILLAVGVPSFSRLIAANRMASQTNELVSSLNLARAEAVRRSSGVSLRTDATTNEFAGGWKIFTDPDLDGAAPSAGDVLRQAAALSAKTTVRRVIRTTVSAGVYTYADATSSLTDRLFITFNSRGGNNSSSAPSFFRLCDSGNTAIPGRIVQINTVGRISLDSATATCP